MLRCCAGRDVLHHAQPGRGSVLGGGHICHPHREAIHAGTGEGRQAGAGRNLLRQDARQRRIQRHGLRRANADAGENLFKRVIDVEQVGHR